MQTLLVLLILFLIVVLLPMPLLVPAWLVARGDKQSHAWRLLLVHVPAMALWVGLMFSGIGAQSLGNIVEGPILGAGAILLAYLKILVVDRFTSRHQITLLGAVGLLLIAALALRIFMPGFSE